MVSDRITTADFGRGRRPAAAPPPYYRHHRRTRWLLILLPVLAIFVGFGSIVWLAYVEGAPASAVGEPPLIKADAGPVKLQPEDPGGREVPDQGEVDELLAGGRGPSGTERLLPPPEEPMVPPSPEELAAAAEGLGEAVADDASRGSPAPRPAGEGGEEVAAVDTGRGDTGRGDTAPGDSGTAGPQASERAIRELFQDGSGGQRQAATSEPAEAPRTLRPPRSAGGTSQPSAASGPSEVAEPARTAAQTAPPAAEQPAERPAERADLPRVSRPSAPAQPETRTAVRTTPAIAPANRLAAPAQEVSLEGPHYRVQLAAVRNEADAQRAWDLFRADYGDVLGGIEPIFERGETTNGVFYRVQLGPYAELTRAERVCEELKQRNASCFVLRR